jgi:hypothetical protein
MDARKEDLQRLLQMIEGRMDDSTRPKKLVGKATDEIIRLFEEKDEREEELKEDMEMRARQLALEVERKVKKEFAVRMKAEELFHKNLWTKIYTEYGLDPSKEYTYNAKEDCIYQYADKVSPFKDGELH